MDLDGSTWIYLMTFQCWSTFFVNMVQLFCFVGSRIYMDLLCFLWVWWTLMGLGTNRKLWVSACFRLERLLGFQSTKQQYKMIIVMRVKPKIVWFFHVVMDVVYQTNMSEIVRGNERAEPGRRWVDFGKTWNHPGVEQKHDVKTTLWWKQLELQRVAFRVVIPWFVIDRVP